MRLILCHLFSFFAVLILAAQLQATPLRFLMPPFYPVGQAPAGAAIGDFNRDGKPDVVTVNHSAGNVSILLNDGHGNLLPAVNYSTGPDLSGRSVVVGDFNGDGKLDLAATGDGPNGQEIAVLLGNGDGTFQPEVSYSPNTFNSGTVTVGDFNGDGKIDLVTVGTTPNTNSTVSVLLGRGDGTFQNAILSTLTSIGGTTSTVVVGDFNRDSKLDVVIETRGQLAFLPGKGDGTFQTNVTLFGGNPETVAAGDVNGDGLLDLVTADVAGSVSSYLSNGDGTFQQPISSAVGISGPQTIALVDLNRDGKLDAVTGGPFPASVTVFLGQGDGTFQSPVEYAVGTGPSNAGGVATADLNGDGSQDVICTNDLASTISVLLGSRTGALRSLVETPSPSGPIAVGDFNGDGKLDLVTDNLVANQVSLLIGKGDATFLPAVGFAVDKGPSSITAADFNGDGALDVATGNAADISVIFGNGNGTFQPPVNYKGFGRTPNSNSNIVSADLNGDGKQDLGWVDTPTAQAPQVAVFLNDGTGTFLNPTQYPAGKAAQSVAFADFNGDGKLDMAIAVSGPAPTWPVSVYLGNGDGTFQSPQTYSTGLPCTQVIATDVNNDGKQDLVLGCGFLVALLGNGDGSFQSAVASGPGPLTLHVAAGDFNGDGKIDIASAGLTLGIYWGNGDGTFLYSDLGLGATNVSVGNLNGDNAPDLVFDNGLAGVLALPNVGGTAVALSSSVNPSKVNQRVTFTARVSATIGGTPTGAVSFKDGNTTLATVKLSTGVGTFTTAKLSVGTHNITATYLGSGHFNPNVSQVLVQVVNP